MTQRRTGGSFLRKPSMPKGPRVSRCNFILYSMSLRYGSFFHTTGPSFSDLHAPSPLRFAAYTSPRFMLFVRRVSPGLLLIFGTFPDTLQVDRAPRTYLESTSPPDLGASPNPRTSLDRVFISRTVRASEASRKSSTPQGDTTCPKAN